MEKPLASKLFTNEIGLIIKCIQHTKMSKKRTRTLMGHQSQTLLLHFTFELKSLLLHLEHILHNPRPVLMLHRLGREGYWRAGSFIFRPLDWSATGKDKPVDRFLKTSTSCYYLLDERKCFKHTLDRAQTGLRSDVDREEGTSTGKNKPLDERECVYHPSSEAQPIERIRSIG